MGPMLAKMGRYEDTQVAHVAPGEVVVPRQLMETNPELRSEVMNAFKEVGVDPAQFVVGGDVVMKNPVTGIQEFGLWSKLKKAVKKLAPVILPVVGSMFLGPVVGAGLGSALDRALRGDKLSDVLEAGARGAAIGGLTQFASNVATGKSGGYMPGKTATTAGSKSTDEIVKSAEAAKTEAANKSLSSSPVPKAPTAPQGTVPVGTGQSQLMARPDIEAARYEAANEATRAAADKAGQEAFDKSITQSISPEGSKNIFGQEVGGEAQRVMFGAPTNALIDTGIAAGRYTLTNPIQAAGIYNIVKGATMDEPQSQEELGMTDAEYEQYMADYQSQVASYGYGPAPVRFVDSNPVFAADGGIINMMNGGFTQGPGTGTSDSIPAYLSDGEFVMTAKAVKGAGKGDPKEGAAKMYAMMDNFERMA